MILHMKLRLQLYCIDETMYLDGLLEGSTGYSEKQVDQGLTECVLQKYKMY